MTLKNLLSCFKKKQKTNQKPLPDFKEELIDEQEDTTASSPEINAMKNQIPEFQYIEELIIYRLKNTFEGNKIHAEPQLPPLNEWKLPLSDFIQKQDLKYDEAVLLLIALIPHIEPDLFDNVIHEVLSDASNFPKLGGVRGKNSRAFLPTGETALFLMTGNGIEEKHQIQELFGAEHLFTKTEILWLEELPVGEPAMSGKIILAQEYVELFTFGSTTPPRFSSNFPAQLITTTLAWSDVVLNDETKQHIEEIENWAKYGNQLLNEWGLANRIKPGFRALFYGPPGTGKTLTASLIGNLTDRAVYKIDLSTIVSKFIGETEKNLSSLFSKAENKNWILFFDEADAIFGKRTNVKDAHDKYANQEVSYLLQRIENFNGMVILASNQKSNIDDAFIRRFQSIINFPMPNAIERAEIWRKSFPDNLQFEASIDFNVIGQKYELAGGNIINVVQFACLKAFPLDDKTIKLEHILEGIRKEYNKDGKMFKI